jgi:hypothetical protein
VRELMPDKFKNWRYIIPPEPDLGAFPVCEDDDLVLTSPYIDLNVLSVSPQVVVANESCTGVVKVLDAAGFEVVPVRHRHRRLFGGGFHCFTLDTVRAGALRTTPARMCLDPVTKVGCEGRSRRTGLRAFDPSERTLPELRACRRGRAEDVRTRARTVDSTDSGSLTGLAPFRIRSDRSQNFYRRTYLMLIRR